MSKVWAVQVRDTDNDGDAIVTDQRVIYADTELQARIDGAGQMRKDPAKVTVTQIGSNPTDAELEARWAGAADTDSNVPDWMRNIHGN